ncbi:MAG TPA: hypothetical protein VFR00_08805 [Hyphomicrobiaceae bacterium]|nr:hypothetical protein [Hyphomicrobiaceae bacterium]
MTVKGGRRTGRSVPLGMLALGLVLLVPAAAEAKRIKIRARPSLGAGWAQSGAPPTGAANEAAHVSPSTSPPGRAEAADARARAALAAERARWSAAASMSAAPVSPDGGMVCLAGC